MSKRSAEDTVFEVKIPAEVMQLITYAAKADGWQPKSRNEAGEEVDNPESPVLRLFQQLVRQATAMAINQMAAEEAQEARNKAIQEMNKVSETWLTAMSNNGG